MRSRSSNLAPTTLEETYAAPGEFTLCDYNRALLGKVNSLYQLRPLPDLLSADGKLGSRLVRIPEFSREIVLTCLWTAHGIQLELRIGTDSLLNPMAGEPPPRIRYPISARVPYALCPREFRNPATVPDLFDSGPDCTDGAFGGVMWLHSFACADRQAVVSWGNPQPAEFKEQCHLLSLYDRLRVSLWCASWFPWWFDASSGR